MRAMEGYSSMKAGIRIIRMPALKGQKQKEDSREADRKGKPKSVQTEKPSVPAAPRS